MSCVPRSYPSYHFFFFFNDTATTEIYTLSLHDALPISAAPRPLRLHRLSEVDRAKRRCRQRASGHARRDARSEEHTSELQSRLHLVCRLLLEKKKKNNIKTPDAIIMISLTTSMQHDNPT